MNREDIIRMAQEAHFNSKTWIDIYKDEITAGDVKGYLEAFAALVASAEREACAKHLDALGCDHCATAIRARAKE